MMFKSVIFKFALAISIGVFSSVTAQASSLYFSGTSSEAVIPNDFDLTYIDGVDYNDRLTVFSGNSGAGLRVRNASTVTFEYLGSEAGYLNRFHYNNDGTNELLFQNHNHYISWSRSEGKVWTPKTPKGTMVSFGLDNIDTLLAFQFWTSAQFRYNWREDDQIANRTDVPNGQVPAGYSIAFTDIIDNTVIAFLGDGFGDSDFDDMAVRISVEAVPLPGALPLFLTALAGLGYVRHRRTKATD